MLKKLIVIMALFALVTGAAFAQVVFGGQMQMGSMLFSGNNVNGNDVTLGGNYDGAYKEAKISMVLGDGKAGGRMVYTLANPTNDMWGWFMWRPNQYFKLRIGKDGDGEGGFPQIIGWGFTGEAKNSVASLSDYNGSLAMQYRNAGLNYGAFDGISSFNFQLSVFPIDMLQVSFLFRGFDSPEPVEEKLANMQIWAQYKIEEIGTVRFAAVGNGAFADITTEGGNIGTFHLAFHTTEIVRGLAFEFGGQYNLPRVGVETFDGIRLAGGINMTTLTDPFNLKVRMGTQFGGKTKGETNEKWGYSIGLLPSYKLPKLTIFCHLGLGLEQDKKEEDVKYDWFINPYIWMPLGGMRMWVGIQIIDEHTQNAGQFGWKIPFGFNFYF